MSKETLAVNSTALALFYSEIVRVSTLPLFLHGFLEWGGGGNLNNNQIEELSPKVFHNNSQWVVL